MCVYFFMYLSVYNSTYVPFILIEIFFEKFLMNIMWTIYERFKLNIT